MNDDEIGAFHEASHAVVAIARGWIKLAGDLVLHSGGYGDAAIQFDSRKVRSEMDSNPAFDCNSPRKDFITCLLAGAGVDRELVRRGLATIDAADIAKASTGDYQLARRQLGKLSPPETDLSDYEREVDKLFGHPVSWCIYLRDSGGADSTTMHTFDGSRNDCRGHGRRVCCTARDAQSVATNNQALYGDVGSRNRSDRVSSLMIELELRPRSAEPDGLAPTFTMVAP